MHCRTLLTATACLFALACSPFVKPTLPGESPTSVREVLFPDTLTLSPTPLLPLLSVRSDTLLIPGQPYNPFRQAEDRHRIDAFWKNFGYFDVDVADADLTFHPSDDSVTVRWSLTEGPRYTLRSVTILNAPPGLTAPLTDLLTFQPHSPIDVQAFRVQRHALADHLRTLGHLRAEVYSRTFVDRRTRSVDWYFYVDAGPPTRIGSIEVRGNHAIPTEAILARAGLSVGDPISQATLVKRELDLMDLGAFAIARINPNSGTEFLAGAVPYESWIPPDTGGILQAAQVDADGNLIPRALSPDLAVQIDVTEAPTTQGRAIFGVNFDPERLDTYAGTRLLLRNAFAPLHHLALQGSIGYGLRWRGRVDDPLGLYGSARAEWLAPGTIGRTGDLRLVLSFDETLFPGFHWRTAAAGLGLRTLIAPGFFFDIEPRLRWDVGVGLGTLIAPSPDLATHPGRGTLAGEARLSLVWDTRNDGVEALSGHLIALRASVAPLGDRTWLSAALDLRYFIPFGSDFGLALRAQSRWVHGLGSGSSAQVPVGARLFGGGAWGMRGFGTSRLSLYSQACGGAAGTDSTGAPRCRSLPTGATALFEGGVDFRWLPFRKQVGAVAFVDVGAVGNDLNPFGEAVEVAVGLGLRLRLWHVPAALDFAYRITDDPIFAHNDALDQFLVFLRIGEAF